MKKNRFWKGILVIVLLLAIGFAAVTTTLIINGTINFGANADDFEKNLIFTAAKLEYSDTSKETLVDDGSTVKMISDDGKSINFTVESLTTIGETATLTYEISNKSQYDASVNDIACIVKTDDATPVDVTDEVVNKKTGEYIKLVPSSTVYTLDAFTGVKSDNTIVITMIKSYAGVSSATKSYNVSCTIVADAEPAAS